MAVSTSVLALLLGGPVSAFQQTEALPKPSASAPGAPPSTLEPSELELSIPDASTAPSKGPTISLPGVGTIGTLPKLDFGLELLYGDEPAASTPEDESLDGDLRIRGSVKHKF
ncbi:MAG: hypothetical protein AAFZ01_14245 [Pseudomonadota bacterium]